MDTPMNRSGARALVVGAGLTLALAMGAAPTVAIAEVRVGTTDVICDPESFSALAHHIARIHNIELPHDFDELIYSRRLMLHMLFGADPSTFARVYTTKDAA